MNRVERYVGAPATFEELRHRPGRRLTLRARGPKGSAIVTLYRSDGVVSGAARIAALAAGPPEPVLPTVLEVDPTARLLLVTDVPGRPLREAAISSDRAACRRAAAALASWHRAWTAEPPRVLRVHTIGDELDALLERTRVVPHDVRVRVTEALRDLGEAWPPATAVHGDLTEESMLIGDRIGLIDLDEVALGPPELDVGNLLAHLDLLALVLGRGLGEVETALLEGYGENGSLSAELLDRCRLLARLRLACIHHEPRLLQPSKVPARPAP